METVRDVLVSLTRQLAFREVAYLVGAGAAAQLSPREAARVQELCAYGQRLLELDSEDLANPHAAEGAATDTQVADRYGNVAVPRHLVARGRRCAMPQRPRELPRGALQDLVPAYGLLFEAIAAHWRRHQLLGVVAGAHIAAEYAPLLAWQSVLGHAGDPARLREDPHFTGADSRWGRSHDRECPHTKVEKSAAARSVRAATEPAPGWRAYLDRQHATVGSALGVCAARCDRTCAVTAGRTADERLRLHEANRAAQSFRSSGLVRLRHAAPVGHGFGVPSAEEILQAWARSRDGLGRAGGLASAALTDDGYPLPGLLSLFSAIAGTAIVPDTLIADTAEMIVVELAA